MSKVILIDPGHGIDTPGKRSPGGEFREYLWNREVADLLVERLRPWEGLGVEVQLVVKETNDIPLQTRAMRVNKVCKEKGAKNVLLLSIHSNACGNGSEWKDVKGWSCYTTKGETSSDEVAECLYDSFEREFPERKIRRDRSDGDRDYEENFYILSKTECKAVLLENFFYDNKEECLWLLKEDTKRRIADAILEGLKIYFSEI